MKDRLGLWIFVAMQSLLWAGAEAALFHEIDTTEPLKCVFSSTYQNRVAVDLGRVEKAIYAEGKVAVQLEETSGQMFIYALDGADSLVISVVTDSGMIQDLEVTFDDRSPEVVVLTTGKVKSRQDRCLGMESRRIAELLNDITSGRTPFGYTYFEGGGARHRIERGVFATTTALFEGSSDTIYLLKVTNQNTHPVQLHERQLSGGFGRWAYLTKSQLEPQEASMAVLAVERGAETRKPLVGDL